MWSAGRPAGSARDARARGAPRQGRSRRAVFGLGSPITLAARHLGELGRDPIRNQASSVRTSHRPGGRGRQPIRRLAHHVRSRGGWANARGVEAGQTLLPRHPEDHRWLGAANVAVAELDKPIDQPPTREIRVLQQVVEPADGSEHSGRRRAGSPCSTPRSWWSCDRPNRSAFDDHHRGVRDVDADLDDGRRDEHVDLAGRERRMTASFSSGVMRPWSRPRVAVGSAPAARSPWSRP